jgi:hypothetical protein
VDRARYALAMAVQNEKDLRHEVGNLLVARDIAKVKAEEYLAELV